jgi:hypothetical protein
MKLLLSITLALVSSSLAFAQDAVKGNVVYQTGGPVGVAGVAVSSRISAAPVPGAPYSATVTNESVQTLADGNRILQTSTGSTARDSQGRTRQDTPLPTIGNMSPANAPRFVVIMDPIAQVSYTLDLTNKNAQKMPMPSGPPTLASSAAGGPVFIQQFGAVAAGESPVSPPTMAVMKSLGHEDSAEVSTEDLGTQTMEGLLVSGVRTTRTIPAGEIGNEKPLAVITEAWTSPDLKTIVYSKRNDPRMGEQVFKLTNIQRAEPDPSLFTVPSDFRLTDGPQTFRYRTSP